MVISLTGHPTDFLTFSPDAALIADSNFLIIDANEDMKTLFGYSRDELLGKSVNILLPEDILNKHDQLQKSFFLHPRLRSIGERQDITGRHKNGALLNIDIKLVSYLINGQRFAMAVIRDVSRHIELRRIIEEKNRELAELNHVLNSHNSQLIELNAIKNEFLGIAAHDLRSPIGAIMGNIDFLLDVCDKHVDTDEMQALKDIRTTTEHMLAVINDFLDISTIESGSITLQIQTCDINQLIDKSLSALSLQSRKKNIPFKCSISPSPVLLHIDPTRIKQVLDNYLSNALKYSYPNSQITITTQVSGNEFICAIADQGQGIEDAFLPTLFQPFQYANAVPTNGESSTGLGLYIVKSIVEKHGGRVWAESTVGTGSTFYFSLPLPL